MPELLHDEYFTKKNVYNERKYTHLHFHNTVELYFLCNGRMKYFVDNNTFQLNKGNLIIVPNNTLHRNDSESCLYNERMLINFSPRDVSRDIYRYFQTLCNENLIVLPDEKVPIIENMLLKIEDEFSKKNEDSATLNKLYLNELLIYLYRYRKKEPTENHKIDSVMQSISDYIFLNFDRDLSLSALSREFSLSESYISRRFKATVGISINEYINFIRVSKAVEMLETKKMPITEIAINCGFNDSNYFSTVFKKLKGVTPYKYMKANHGK